MVQGQGTPRPALTPLRMQGRPPHWGWCPKTPHRLPQKSVNLGTPGAPPSWHMNEPSQTMVGVGALPKSWFLKVE